MNPKTILVVDDNPVVTTALGIKLRQAGYNVLTAPDGGEAVNQARHNHPDLILLDITFPPDVAHGGGVAWDGFLIMNWLRRMGDAASIPIIVITGGDSAKYEKRAMDAGAVAFFQKPIDYDTLVETIRLVLGQDEEQPEAEPAPPAPWATQQG